MQNLHKQFVQLGRQKNKIQYRLLQLLPQICEEGIYKKYCKTIEGYAWRFAQIPKAVVHKTLSLEKHLENKPFLKAVVAEVGIHKVALIAKIATSETDSIFAEKVKNMSRNAVVEFYKELHCKNFTNQNENQRDLFKEFTDSQMDMRCMAKANILELNLDEEMTFLFLKIKQKFEKSEKKQFNNKEILKKMMESVLQGDVKSDQVKDQKNMEDQKKQNFPGKISENSKIEHQEDKNWQSDEAVSRAVTRYIPVKLRRLAVKQSNHKCSYPNCNKPPEVFHHPERFAETGNHENIKPLCKPHHEFMHNGLVEYEAKDVGEWNLNMDRSLNVVDQLYQKYRSG